MTPEERNQSIVSGFLGEALGTASPREKKLITALQNLAYGGVYMDDWKWSKKTMRLAAYEALQQFVYDFMKEQYPVGGKEK